MWAYMRDERRLDVVDRIAGIAEEAGLSMTHLAMAFAIAHPGVSAAIIGPRTMAQLEDLLAGAGTTLDDDVLDQVDGVVPPGTDVSELDMAYRAPALMDPALRRRAQNNRSAA